MKAAYILLTATAAAVPFVVPAAGATVLGLGEDMMNQPRSGVLAALATLAWAMLGLRLIKA